MKLNDSIFRFENPVLNEMYFKVNDDFKKEKMETDTESANGRISVKHEDNDLNEAFVYLTITIGEKGDSFPFELKATMGSNFLWPEGLAGKTINTLLTVNAPALLLSYIRPIVSSITDSSEHPTYHIPFIDFSSKEMTTDENDD
ncbi:protein-export chaperone SecB [Listeria seeligeri]|uniref:protein-export chaperone SecB n=2 Tax=Listeria seeligeri TaxID=1640 RepID=UPI001629F8C0|nr:protein-export chaperone SecB [Listeria seeligeri]MBC1429842.1 hypothetical protein [Listeria seeligeri]